MIPNNPLLRKPSRPLPKNVVVVGAGTIGPDIGYYLKSAIPELEAAPCSTSRRRRSIARCSVSRDYARKAVERGKMSRAQADRVRANIHADLDYEVGARRRLGDRGRDRGPRAQAANLRPRSKR